jgi:chaperonin GroES
MAKDSNFLSKVKPSSGYILIEPQEADKQTTSGIYLPDSASGDKPQQGKILAVGPEELTEKGLKKSSPAQKGDLVIYKKWGGNEVKIEGKEYLFVKFEDILAVIS